MNDLTVRGGNLSYKSVKNSISIFLIATIFFLYFSNPLLMEGILHIQLPLVHLDPTLIDHLSPYLSVYPIKHPLQFSVSCDSKGSTIRESSQHKCGQKSSCNTFNALDISEFPSSLYVYDARPYNWSLLEFLGRSP